MKKPSKYPLPPPHLDAAGTSLWEAVVADYDLDAIGLELLDALCTAVDRRVEARRLIDTEGIIVRDRFQQQRPNPAVAIEREATATMSRLARVLGLTLEPVRTGGMRLRA